MSWPVWSLLGCMAPPVEPVPEILPVELPPEGPADPYDGLDVVEVAVPRELRGMWIATVSNLDFPSRTGLPPSALRRELDVIVAKSLEIGINALVFQVRPEGDAVYESELEPWSRFLSGRQGHNPGGFDPLSYLIERAHEEGIEVHAWFNPYRAQSSRGSPAADNHVSRWGSKHMRPWGKVSWLDPGVPEIQKHAVAVVADVLNRYDVDGIHLDDYFYPYPEGGRAFPDEESYGTYRKGGGKLERSAWRRDNVDSLVKGLAELVHEKRPEVRFGISPFGIYRPGIPAGIRGMDQVAVLNADPLKWFAEGWTDYLAPQLYWPTTSAGQRYSTLVDWWSDQVAVDRPLIVGLDLTKVGKDPAWTLGEMRSQVSLARAQPTAGGQIWFRASPILTNQAGMGKLLDELYAEPAVLPPLPRLQDRPTPPPVLVAAAGGLTIEHPERAWLRSVVVYRAAGDGFKVDRIVGPGVERIDLAPGTWAVSAVSRTGVESMGIRIVIGADDGTDGVTEAP